MKARSNDGRRTLLLFGAAVLTGVVLAYLLVVLYFFPTEPADPALSPADAPPPAAAAPGTNGS